MLTFFVFLFTDFLDVAVFFILVADLATFFSSLVSLLKFDSEAFSDFSFSDLSSFSACYFEISCKFDFACFFISTSIFSS